MKHISKEQLDSIDQKATLLLEDVEKAVLWLKKNKKGESEKVAGQKIKKIRREVKKVKYALSQNSSSALYGESQVGKSYLIKNLLSHPLDNSFEIKDKSSKDSYSFLQKINPAGKNTEATSVVTRFSTQVKTINDDFPIVVRLLSPKDIILLLCDTYFSDVKDHIGLVKTAQITNHISSLQETYRNSSVVQSALTEDDVLNIKDYLQFHFRNFTVDLINSDFWLYVSEIIGSVPSNQWNEVFKILWGSNTHITDIFNKLIRGLDSVNFSHTIYAEFKAVLRQYGTLLHVARLREINGDPIYEDVKEDDFEKNVRVLIPQENSGREATINKSILCALTAELVFEVDKELEVGKKFLKYSDLLDFPGARSRLKNQEKSLSADQISDMVLRGKVSYIFNKFSSQHLISNLFFCNKDAKIEVKYIPELLNTWIETYIGADATERGVFLEGSAFPPLFLIYTFFNEDLKYDPINDKLETLGNKWTKRFQTIFENEIVTKSFNWHKKWTTSNPYFQNNYMLRDFHYSDNFYRKENKKEVAEVENEMENYIGELKKSFKEHEFVQKHFENSELSWNEAAGMNKDGSDLIIKNLTKISGNFARVKKFVRALENLSEQLKDEMNAHYRSDEADNRIQEAFKQAGSIHLSMDTKLNTDDYAFGYLVKGFLIKESQVYNFFREKLRTLETAEQVDGSKYFYVRDANKEISINKSYEENIEVLMRTYKLNSQEDVEKHFADQEIDLNELFYGEAKKLRNNSIVLAEALKEFWFDTCLVGGNFERVLELGFPAPDLENIFDNLRVAYDKHTVTDKIAANIREYVDRFEKIDEAEEMIADISTATINKFVTSMGWDFYTGSEIEELKETNKANDLNLNFDVHHSSEYPDTEELSTLFELVHEYQDLRSDTTLNHEKLKQFPHFRNRARWKELLKISFVANCDIPTYDVLANKDLGELLENMKVHSFEVPSS